MNFCQNVRSSHARVGHDLQPYFQACNNISFQRGLVLKGDQIIYRKDIAKKTLNNIHKGHQGITECHA